MPLDSTRLSYVACGLSAAALVLGSLALTRSTARSGPADRNDSSQAASIQALQAETARLRAELDELRAGSAPTSQQLLPLLQRLAAADAAVAQRRPEANSPASDARPKAVSNDPLDHFRPAYAAIKSANPAVAIRQNPDRTFDVSSTDPALTGTPLQVEATRADGAVDHYTVIVPAPGGTAAPR